MRTITILLSVVAHALVVCAVIVSSVTATDELPVPRRAMETVIVRPQAPAPPPKSSARARRDVPSTALQAVPLEPPDGIHPEREQPAIDDRPDPNTAIGAGLEPGTSIVEPPPPIPRPEPSPRAPLRVGGDIQPPVKVRHVAPVYPGLALQAHVSGIVILEAVIAEDGAVRDVKVLRGKPLLDEAAVEAVRQWRFTPTMLNGQPVPVAMTVTVSFGLTP